MKLVGIVVDIKEHGMGENIALLGTHQKIIKDHKQQDIKL
jgi:hypothetical protein